MAMTLYEMYRQAGVSDPPSESNEVSIVFRHDKDAVPRPYQIAGLNQALISPRYGLYDDPGLGKTLVAQAYAFYYASLGNKVMVVMPPILMEQFLQSWEEVLVGASKHVKPVSFCGGPSSRTKIKLNPPKVLTMSYNIFRSEFRWLESSGYNVMIADEAQALKNIESKAYRMTAEFEGKGENETALLLMTGSPAHKDVGDTYALITLTNRDAYSGYDHFKRRHMVYRRITNKLGKYSHSVLVRFDNVEEIYHKLYRRGRKVPKSVLGLGKPVITEVPVRLSKEHTELYKRIVNERMLQLTDEELLVFTTQQKLREACLQVIVSPDDYSQDKIGNSVLEAIDAILDGVTDSKVILFATHKSAVRTLATKYAGHNPALAYGDSNSRKAVASFKTDDSCKMLIANILSCNAGLDLQDNCNYVIFVEPTTVPGNFKQAVERVWRSGQKRQVFVYIIKALGTVARDLTAKMLEREKTIVVATGDRRGMLAHLLGS